MGTPNGLWGWRRSEAGSPLIPASEYKRVLAQRRKEESLAVGVRRNIAAEGAVKLPTHETHDVFGLDADSGMLLQRKKTSDSFFIEFQ